MNVDATTIARTLHRFLQRLLDQELVALNYLRVLFKLYSCSDLPISDLFNIHGGHQRNLLLQLEEQGWVTSEIVVRPTGARTVRLYRLTSSGRRSLTWLSKALCPSADDRAALSRWLERMEARGATSFMRLHLLARITVYPGLFQKDLFAYKSGFRRQQIDRLLEQGLITEATPAGQPGPAKRYYPSKRWLTLLARLAQDR